MLKSIALVCVLTAVGCKADAPEPAATTNTDPAAQGGTTGRSGKIDLGTRKRPHTSDGSSSDGTQPQLDDRRKERMAEIDTDGDGEISDTERKVARAKRAEDMHARLDKDGDGKVTPAELSGSQFRRFNPESVDSNKDGDVSIDELAAALESRSRAWGAGRRGRRGQPDATGSGATPPTPTPTPAP